MAQDRGRFYRATALHNNAAVREKHEGFGFHYGWGTTLKQLADLADSL